MAATVKQKAINMEWKRYWRSLEPDEKIKYAKEAGCSARYIAANLIPKVRMPRKELMENLALKSEGHVTFREVLEHFYGDIDR
jgi:hypothetical protein